MFCFPFRCRLHSFDHKTPYYRFLCHYVSCLYLFSSSRHTFSNHSLAIFARTSLSLLTGHVQTRTSANPLCDPAHCPSPQTPSRIPILAGSCPLVNLLIFYFAMGYLRPWHISILDAKFPESRTCVSLIFTFVTSFVKCRAHCSTH